MSPGSIRAVHTARLASVALVVRTSAKAAPISRIIADAVATPTTSAGSSPAW
jgi:hypothetical protein